MFDTLTSLLGRRVFRPRKASHESLNRPKIEGPGDHCTESLNRNGICGLHQTCGQLCGCVGILSAFCIIAVRCHASKVGLISSIVTVTIPTSQFSAAQACSPAAQLYHFGGSSCRSGKPMDMKPKYARSRRTFRSPIAELL